jgi:uncharacterized protein YpmB
MNPDSQQQPVAPAPNPQPMQPAPTPGPMSSSPMGGQMPMAGGKNKNMLIGIIVVAVIVVAAAAWGVYAYISNTPDNLMRSAVQNIQQEKSFAATFKATGGTGGTSVTFSGDVAASTDTANDKNGEVIVGFGTGDQRVSLSMMSLDESLYFKGTSLESLGPVLASMAAQSGGNSSALSSPEFTAMLKHLNNQWFVLTKDEVQSVAQSSGNDSVSGAVSPADVKKALDIYNQHSFIVPDKTFPDEVVDGANSAHFNLKVDKDKQVAFMQAVKDANLSTIKFTDSDIAKAKNAIVANNDGMSQIEVWVARDSKKFKQFRVANTKQGEEMSVTLTLTGKLPTFDKFEKPADAKPVSQLMTLLLGSSLPADDFSDL